MAISISERVPSGARALATAAAGWLLAGALAGCGTIERVYTIRPLPSAVHPADESWGLDVAVDITDAIHLQVANASQEVVRIAWDDCAYIDVEGRSHRLLRARAARTRDHGPQVPTAVSPNAHIKETLYPVADELLQEDDPLLPSRGKPRNLAKEFPSVGKTIGVSLVFERGADRKTKTVTATYLIADVEAKRHWW